MHAMKIGEARRVRHLILALALPALLAATTAGTLTAAGRPATVGRIPADAFHPGQPLDLRLVPDYVSVLGSDGTIAGYIQKEAMVNPDLDAKPVFAADLATVVGHMIAGRGFVRLGDDPASAPLQQVETKAVNP